jgi:nucleoside-triphosphatase THEP1/tetratricopeptide (TPR) repeat protein
MLVEKRHRVVLITGAPGVGKTAITDRIMENARSGSPELASRFNRHLSVSGFRQPWATVMALVGQVLLGREIAPKATVQEVQEHLIAAASKEKILLIIDNIEVGDYEAASAFFRKWVAASHQSVLLATTFEAFFHDPCAEHLSLAGLSSKYAQLELLGEPLKKRFGEEMLLDRVGPLNGVPLSLLYLRWVDPETEGELSDRVARLNAGTLDRLIAIENLLDRVTRTPAPFMALGIVRRLQFDESLLAFLWDRMGGGSSEAYVAMRNGLVAERLLIPMQDVPGTYRVNEDIHKQLYAALSRRIGENRIENIHFFVAEYYRRQYELRETVHDLQSFLYHCIECGEYDWAYACVFETDILQRLQRGGLALQLRALMDQLLTTEAGFSDAQRAQIYLATAAVCNDLSDFEACLDCTRRAKSVFKGVLAAPAVRRQIAYYSAVAYSNTGCSIECLRSYYEVIAASPEPVDSLACLALAYLGHELKYHDMELSLRYGCEALEIARYIKEPGVLARVLCSLAETEIFTNSAAGALAHFEEALNLCGDGAFLRDAREMGRVLKNWGLFCLIKGDLDGASSRLRQARDLSEKVRDRRRVASGDVYCAIALYRRGSVDEGIKVMRAAIAALHSLKDGRYLVPALMTLTYWTTPSYDCRLATLGEVLQRPDDAVADAAKGVTAVERFEIYADFWRKYFNPVVVLPKEGH